MTPAKIAGGCSGAIVIGGDYRGLGVVRSLGRRGIPICVLTDNHVLASLSRFCTFRLEWPEHEKQQLSLLHKMGASSRFAGWSVFPTGDESAALLSRNHARLSKSLVITTPSWEVFHWAYDKLDTYKIAASVGVPTPETLIAHDRDELKKLECHFPAILKPSRKHRPSRLTQDKAWPVADRVELLSRYDQARSLIEPEFLMVQELLPRSRDSQFSFAALALRGGPLMSVIARRSRQYPLDFGKSSSFVETVDEPQVEELARKVLKAIQFTGLVEVEFMRDRRDGRLKLLDINPRVWGWHSLGQPLEIDFAYAAWRLANGYPIAPLKSRAGISWLRGTTDVLACAQQIWRREFLPGQYLRSLNRDLHFAIWAKDDPVPSLCEIPSLLYARHRWRRSLRSHTAQVPALMTA